MNSDKKLSRTAADAANNFNLSFSFEEFENNDTPQNKKQIVAMVKKLHLAAIDVIKLINHYKKFLVAGHIIPDEIIEQLQAMANQLTETAADLVKKADGMTANLDEQIKNTNKLIKQAESILKSNKI